MTRRWLRWVRRLLILIAGAGALVALAHTPWVRALALKQITATLRQRTGFDFAASRLDYNLLSLTVNASDLRISRPGDAGAPVLLVRQLSMALSRRSFSGALDAAAIDADGVSLVIDLSPRTGEPAGARPAEPFKVPVFTVGHAVLRHTTIDVIDPGGLGHLAVRDATLDLEGGGPRRLEGSVVVAGGLTLDNADTRARVDRLEGRAFVDGDTIGVRPASASAGTHRVALDGSLTFTGPSPRFDLGIAGDVDVAQLSSWFPAMPAGNGPLQLTGRVTGPLDNPRFTYSARSPGVTVPDIRVPASTAEGYISRTGIFVERLRTGIGRGWVEATGRLPLGLDDPNSRFSLKWNNVAIAGLAKVFPLLPADPIGMVATGSARVHWSGMALEFATVAGDVTSELRFAPDLQPTRVRMDGTAGRWTIRGEQELEGSTRASLDAAVTISAADVTLSQLLGTLNVSSANLQPALAEARRAFPDLPDVSAWLLDTPLTMDGTLDGTISAPRLSGMASSQRLRLHGLPAFNATATFAADAARLTVSNVAGDDGTGNRLEGNAGVEFDAETTTGTFTAKVKNPEPFLKALVGTAVSGSDDDRLKAGGSVLLAGKWDGPISDPAVSMTVRATDLSVANATFSLERATAEGRLDGPVSHPEATLRITAGAIRGASLQPVPADAQLSLKAGRLDVTARVPDWSAALSGHASIEAPHEFAGTVSVADLTAARLVTLLGGQDPAWTADGTISATLEAAGRFDNRSLHLGGQAALAGGALRVGESRLMEGVGAAVEVRDGRLWLTRLAGLGFSGPLSSSGDLPLRWVEEYLPEGWRVDDAGASPKPASFELRAEPDVQTLGTWIKPEEPAKVTGALRLRASGTASAASLAAIDGRIVIEPDTVTVKTVPFTLPQAAAVRIKDGRAIAEDVTVTAPGTTATVSGTVGLTGDRALDARLSASGALGFLSSVVPGRLAGAFNATFKATGTAADPQLSGRLSLDNAAWVWPEQHLALRDWSGEAVLTARTLTIEKLAGHLNGGDADVAGAVTFGDAASAGLTMRVRDAFAEVVKGFRSQADADLTLESVAGGARLSGKVTVTSGAYREPITAMARLFAAPRTTAAASAGEASLLGDITLDVDLTSASPIVIENSAGRLDLAPSMKVQGTLAEPALFGTLDMIDSGRLTLLGRTFRLTEGRVVFPGVGDPSVQLIGETRVGDYAVTLRTQGPVTNLEATYSSDPPLSQRDLQSLLVTGRTTDVSSTKSRGDEQFVLGTASSDLLGVAGQMVGLDSVQLGRGDFELGSSDVNPAMRLTVTKGINARTSLVLSQDLDNNKLTWIVIFIPARGYEVRLSQRDNLEEVVEFRQELSFGPGVSPPSTSGFRKRLKGPRVSSVEFTGALGYQASELESILKLKPPKEFDAGIWQEDRARLEAFYRDRGYALARIVPERAVVKDESAGRVALKYRVDPGPHTVLTVSGIDLPDGDRRALMRVWSGSVLPEFLQEDITRRLRELLASRGHLRPSITVTIDTPNPRVMLANVAVTPGPVTQTRRLAIEGTRAVAEPELRAAISGTPELERAWVDPAPLVESLAAVYAGRGYPSARISADDLAFDGDAAELRLRITEGPQAVVTEIVMTGVADTRAADARSALAIQPGQPFLPGTEGETRRRLERFYLDRGFRSAAVRSTVKTDRDGGHVLSLSVAEGPVSIVNAIAVTGLDATKPGVADGAITLKPGQSAGQQDVSETQKRLYGLGVFRSAVVNFKPATQAQAADAVSTPVDVTVSVEEARRYQLRYGVQLSNQYGPVLEDFSSALGVAGDIRDRNFLGRAFTLGASTRLEKNLQSLRGQFSLPTLLNQRLQTNYFVTFRSETDTSEESVTYTDKERDVTFEQRLRLPRHMEVSWGYSYNVRDVTLMNEPRAASERGKGALGSLNGTFIVDKRDKPFDASRGWFQSSNLQWGLRALGSDFDYVRALVRQFYYRPAGPFVFASGVRGGWLHGLADVPYSKWITLVDQFFDAGGGQTVRGYAEDSLSAVDYFTFPVGGTKLLLLNQEVRFPLFSKWFQGAVFIDAGNTFAPGESVKLDRLAVGTGFGIRIMTPFAPIRIDLGYPLDRRPEDRSYRVYVSIGQIF